MSNLEYFAFSLMCLSIGLILGCLIGSATKKKREQHAEVIGPSPQQEAQKPEQKRILTRVVVEATSTVSNYRPSITIIDVPKGGTFKLETIGNRCTVCSASGEVEQVFDWQAGYTHVFTYKYELA